MARLPTPGSDNGKWGSILNEFLSQVHSTDGTLKTDSVTSDAIAPNAVTSAAIAPNAITNTALASNAVDAAIIQDGSITETLLDAALQTKINSQTFADSSFTLQDTGDITKQARFELSSISTGTTRTYTLPNATTTLVDIDSAQTLTNKTLTDVTLGGNGATLDVGAGNTYTFAPANAATDLNIKFQPKGSGVVSTDGDFQFLPNGPDAEWREAYIKDPIGNNTLAIAAEDYGATNYWLMASNTSGQTPYLLTKSGVWSDVVKMKFGTQNSGAISFLSNTRTGPLSTDITNTTVFRIQPVASSINYLQVSSSVTGSPLQIQAVGGDTNVSINLLPAGTGTVRQNGVDVATVSGTQTLTNKTLTSPKIQLIADTAGNTAIQTLPRASAVNYVVIANSATGSGPEIGPTGADLSIDMNVSMRGTSKAINLIDGGGGVIAKFTSQGSVVNYVRVHPGVTGVSPYISGEGSDTNISLNLKSKGTGTVQANGLEVVTTTGTQTLTNKTLTSPTITGATMNATTIATDTTTGLKLGTGTTQKLGFWNATPIAQPTTAVAAATFVANSGTTINDASTFDGYTLKQVVKALRNAGLLA